LNAWLIVQRRGVPATGAGAAAAPGDL